MKRPKIPVGEKIALALSAIALLISLWSLVESRRASSTARWTEFRASTLTTLADHRRTYSQVTCLFHATNTEYGLEEFGRFKSNLDNLEGSLNHLRGAGEATLAKFETHLDASNASFRRLNDAVTELKSNLTPEQLSRVTSICGNEG